MIGPIDQRIALMELMGVDLGGCQSIESYDTAWWKWWNPKWEVVSATDHIALGWKYYDERAIVLQLNVELPIKAILENFRERLQATNPTMDVGEFLRNVAAAMVEKKLATLIMVKEFVVARTEYDTFSQLDFNGAYHVPT